MPELLLEVGCEELPASFVRRAYSDLLQRLTSLLDEAGILDCVGVGMGTPRRLVVSFSSLKPRQEDQVKVIRGPGIKAAFDENGGPTPALAGFCKSQGVELSSVTKDKQYVWVSKLTTGRATVEILAEAIPKTLRSMPFDKSMRWGDGRMRFARPIRWILAAFDNQVIPFEIEGVATGLESRGHRFYANERFAATNLSTLVEGLRERKVELDPDIRRNEIASQAQAAILESDDADGKCSLELTPDLVEENTYLTEWPTAIQGRFKKDYLELPEAVLVTAMAKHERMFPVRNEAGQLTNRFVFIRNSGKDDSVRSGCEWVLNARINDAKFFFDEDVKHDLNYFLERTEGILFQEKLGSIRKRADRLAELSEWIAKETGALGREIQFARSAGLYAKADLSSGLVSELASLQGIIGGVYARRNGFFGSVAWAIETHYDISKNLDPGDCAGERASIRLAMADHLDKLAGYLGIGYEPTGSSDPYGLRRSATVLIEAALMWPSALPSYRGMFAKALSLYRVQGIELDENAALAAFNSVMASRYSSMLPNVRHDILDAAMLTPGSYASLNPREISVRCECMGKLAEDKLFILTATRPLNILTAARKKGSEFSGDGDSNKEIGPLLDSKEGSELLAAAIVQEDALRSAVFQENVDEIVSHLKTLAPPINRFFDSTMVMTDDPTVRRARLSMLELVSRQLLMAGDFSRIEGVS